ncbi:hypothetical protein [Streptomyces canus]|uniref:hypothetical protein n=1 Tax=Streptomyces canus TaxID=58343 RepID=UPI002E280E89|nr:hypothetical protein [Streptomyces canus]
MREHLALLEWYGERWRYVGGGSSSGDGPVDVDVLDVCHGAGALSLTRGRDLVLIGDRRIDTPEQRRLIAVWTSPRIGPHDSLDTHTWARWREGP